MRAANVAWVLAGGLLGCAAPDGGTTLSELRRGDAMATAELERDACSCSCGKLICWNFSCTGNGCSRADEYVLIVERGPGGQDACFDATPGVTAQLFVDGEDPLAADATALGCGQLGFRWRRPRAAFASSPHRVEIGDGSDTWSIDEPFTPASLAVVAPPALAAAPPAEPALVRAGEAIVLSVAPPLRLTDAGASLRSPVTHDSTALPVEVRDGELALTVPASTPPGRYDLQVGAGTLLPADACDGPAVCRGLDVATMLAVRVE